MNRWKLGGFFLFDARVCCVHGGSLNELLCRTMVLLVSSCWFFVCNSIFGVIRFIITYFLRFRIEKSSGKDDANFGPILQEEDRNESRESNSVPKAIQFEKTEYNGFEKKEPPTFGFTFKFQFESPEEIRRKIEESEEPVHQERKNSTETNVQLYRFLGEKDFVGFIEQPEVFSLRVEYSCPKNKESSSEDADVFKKELTVQKVRSEESVPSLEFDSNNHVAEETFEKPEVGTLVDDQISTKESLFELHIDTLTDMDAFDEAQFLSQKDFFVSNSDLESLNSFIEISAGDQAAEISDGFLSEGDFTGPELENLSDFEEETHLQKSCYLEKEFIWPNDDMNQDQSSLTGSSAFVNQIINSNPSEERNPEGDSSIPRNGAQLIGKIEESEHVQQSFDSRAETQITEIEYESQVSEGIDFESLTDSDSLWEHQDLIEQLRMELRKVRAIGLPTILEDSESPKTMDDLKPWKFEEKFSQEDPMDELQKFYNNYRKRMRKFDTLNYQNTYAISFLRLKDPLQSRLLTKKTAAPTLTSLRPRRRKVQDDRPNKLIKDLQSDLETVYVGQTCLSWELLQWQHGKACESADPNDTTRARSYNQVAGEFQQFQVVLLRFLENEKFEGPRVQNYVKSRCVLRNLLQVPTIREDSFEDRKDERRWRRENPDVVSCTMLVNIIEESMRIMWEFIKGDREETGLLPRGFSGSQAGEFQDPSNVQLFHDVQTDFQKKEKKLRDLVRSGQCLVKRFQKHKGDDTQQVMFLAQADIKLVGRVLRMTRVTSDQLMWCDKKLNRITFSDRKIHREPSFLLFPC